MKKNGFIIFFLFIYLVSYAQDSNDELLKKLVEKNILTQDEANEIVKESSAKKDDPSFEQVVGNVREAFSTPYMNFGGYGLFTYQYNDMAKTKHNFEPRVIFLSMGGKLPHNLGYNILFEFVNPRLHEFYLDWTPSEKFNLRVGQFKVPFTIENPISLTALETVYYTRSASAFSVGDYAMKKQNGINNTGRDIGVQVSGNLIPIQDHNFLEYALGVFQGSGLNSSDKNNTKDFAGTIMLHPVKGFRIGGGAYFGQATYTMEGDNVERNHNRNRWTFGAEYKSDRLYGRTEWIRGKDGHTYKEGLYGTVQYYLLPKKLNAVGKVDYYNDDKDTGKEVIDYTFALNYFFYQKCRVQLNYTYSDYSSVWGDKNTNSVVAQLQISF